MQRGRRLAPAAPPCDFDLHRGACDRDRGRRPHRRQRHRGGVRRLRARDPAAGLQRQEQHRAYGSRRLPLRPAQGRSDDAAAHLRADIEQASRMPNPDIDFDSCPMQDADGMRVVPRPSRGRRGINSFGFGGANGHCVVREYRPALSEALVDAAGATKRASWSLALGTHAQGAHRERAPVAPICLDEQADGPLRAGRQSQPPPHPISPHGRAFVVRAVCPS